MPTACRTESPVRARAFRVAAVAVAALLAGCRSAEEPVTQQPTTQQPASTHDDEVVVRNCTGPATSLVPELAATLPARTGNMIPDDQWADLAATVPGGFAGVLYDPPGHPVIMLTDPSRAAEAKAALAGHIPNFPLAQAEPRQARWDFAQLVDWFNYLSYRTPVWGAGGATSGDKDERANRIRFGAADAAARDRLARLIEDSGVPCDLVIVDIQPPATWR